MSTMDDKRCVISSSALKKKVSFKKGKTPFIASVFGIAIC